MVPFFDTKLGWEAWCCLSIGRVNAALLQVPLPCTLESSKGCGASRVSEHASFSLMYRLLCLWLTLQILFH